MKRGFDRKERVADLIQKALAQMLLQHMPDDHFRFVTITSVEMSRDLSYAKVYVTLLIEDKTQVQDMLVALNREAKALRYQLAKAVKLRIVPELKFVFDESTAHGFRISSLIDEAMNKTGKK